MHCLSFLRDGVSSKYLKEIKNMPVLSKDEQFKLANDWAKNKNPASMEKLVKGHMRLVVSIAKGYSGYGVPMHDLISEGSIGMLQAIDHFKPEMGYKLSTYSSFWIKARIQEYIYNTKSLVKIGANKAYKKLFFCLNQLKQKLGINKVTDENAQTISDKTNIDKKTIIDADNRFNASDFSIHANVKTGDTDSSTWEDFLPDTKESVEDIAAEQQEILHRKELLHEALDTLSRRDRDIVIWYRLREPPVTLERIGKKLGISKERVRQLESRAMLRIKDYIKKKSKEELK